MDKLRTFGEWLRLREMDAPRQPTTPQAKTVQQDAQVATAQAMKSQLEKTPNVPPQVIAKQRAGNIVVGAANKAQRNHPNDQQPPIADIANSITPVADQMKTMRKK